MVHGHMRRKIEIADRLCYACNEGSCARCTGWDWTVLKGEIVLVSCAHECRANAQRKMVQRSTRNPQRVTRRA